MVTALLFFSAVGYLIAGLRGTAWGIILVVIANAIIDEIVRSKKEKKEDNVLKYRLEERDAGRDPDFPRALYPAWQAEVGDPFDNVEPMRCHGCGMPHHPIATPYQLCKYCGALLAEAHKQHLVVCQIRNALKCERCRIVLRPDK